MQLEAYQPVVLGSSRAQSRWRHKTATVGAVLLLAALIAAVDGESGDEPTILARSRCSFNRKCQSCLSGCHSAGGPGKQVMACRARCEAAMTGAPQALQDQQNDINEQSEEAEDGSADRRPPSRSGRRGGIRGKPAYYVPSYRLSNNSPPQQPAQKELESDEVIQGVLLKKTKDQLGQGVLKQMSPKKAEERVYVDRGEDWTKRRSGIEDDIKVGGVLLKPIWSNTFGDT
mmetsp:Transcript_29417/g.68209  ORF Transcript_29417/g.68209 Transcript_29417/m.68209 type:complete len:230 (-) Transcript_29417:127-816(-)